MLVILGVELTRRRHQHLQLLLRPNTGRQQHLGNKNVKERLLMIKITMIIVMIIMLITCVRDFSRLLTVAVSRTPSVVATFRHFGTVSEPCKDDHHIQDHHNDDDHHHDLNHDFTDHADGDKMVPWQFYRTTSEHRAGKSPITRGLQQPPGQ